jgi:hypothetical protein
VFYGSEFYLSWWLFHVCLRICILLFLDEVLSKYPLGQVIDNAIQFNNSLIDFLPSSSVNYWRRGFDVFNYNSGVIYLLITVLSFFSSHILMLCYRLWIIVIGRIESFTMMYCFSLPLTMSLFQQSAYS